MNTILFDLDGTLLPMDLDAFMQEYMKRICSKLNHILPPEKTNKFIWDSTVEMIKNLDPDKTNKDVFMEHFCNLACVEGDFIYDVFLDFYNNEYREISGMYHVSDEILEAVAILKSKGFELVIATNPLFPMQAIQERIKWAGLNGEDFKLVTCFEEMHFCKPQTQYYEEILKRINKTPEECLMVGNDVVEDLAAKIIGVKTYLIKDHVINRKNIEFTTDYQGSYSDFLEYVKNLPMAKES
jgi:FMN phosphatase YigB (HAD superfamily)